MCLTLVCLGLQWLEFVPDPDAMFTMLDADSDGRVSQAELEAAVRPSVAGTTIPISAKVAANQYLSSMVVGWSTALLHLLICTGSTVWLTLCWSHMYVLVL